MIQLLLDFCSLALSIASITDTSDTSDNSQFNPVIHYELSGLEDDPVVS